MMLKSKKLLIEDDGGGYGDSFGYGGFGMGGMGVGGNIVSDQLLYKTFISGWSDLFRTAKSATKSIAATTIANIKIVLASCINAVLPWYRENYQEIFKKLHESQNKIRSEHQNVYRSIASSLIENDDFLVSAFFYDPSKFFNTALTNPATFVTSMGALKAPGAIASTLDTLMGGGMLGGALKNVYSNSKDWETIQTKLKAVLGNSIVSKIVGDKGTTESFDIQKPILLEDSTDSNAEELSKDQLTVIKLLLNPKVLQQVMSSNEAQKLAHEQRNVTNAALQQVVKTVTDLKRATSIEQILKTTGQKIEGLDKLQPDELKKLVDEIKSTVQKMYVTMLTAELKHLMQKVPSDNGLVKAYKTALQAIS